VGGPDATQGTDGSGTTDGPVGPDDVQQPPGEGGGPPVEGGVFDAGTLGDGSTPYVGKIVFEELQQGSTTYSFIDANFSAQGGLDPAFGCPAGAATAGACCYVTAAAADAGTANPVSAGTIDIFADFAMVASMPYGPQGYAPSTTAANLWLPDQTLKAVASGATVQAFMGGVLAPEGPLQMTPPVNMQATVSVGADWNVTWTPGAAGSHVLAKLTSNAHGFIQCTVDDSTGTIAFPASLMSNLTSPEMGTLELGRLAFGSASAANAYVEIAIVTGQWVDVTFTP
jgi:hypothetical protein